MLNKKAFGKTEGFLITQSVFTNQASNCSVRFQDTPVCRL